MDTIVSGARPTGLLHLGHLHGALRNWARLQENYRCFFFVADWHALTTDYQSPDGIREGTGAMVAEWLSVGLDPAKCTIFRQSDIKEHAELHLLLSMLTPVSWLERNPTYKEQLRELGERDLSTYGFLGYPVLQAADIIMYKAPSGSRGGGSGAPRGADPGDRPAVQQLLRSGVPRTGGVAHGDPAIAGTGRTQDEQELRQLGPVVGFPRDHRPEAEPHGDGYRSRPADGSR